MTRRIASASLTPVFLLALSLSSGCRDATGVTWHSYTNSHDGLIHFSLNLSSYKRGLFFGSCGPSTRSLQWQYRIELKGAGPTYGKEDIGLQDGDLHPIGVESGSIFVDHERKAAKIDIAIIGESKAGPFAHNGTYRMQKEP